MLKFIHLTDTHIVAPGRTLYDLDPALRLRRAIESVNREHPDAAFVVVTGDLAHWGEAAAYEVLREELARLIPPRRLLIGNHDDRQAFLAAFPATATSPGAYVQYTFDAGDIRHVVLDSNEPGVSWGVFCEQRADWLDARVSESPMPVMIYIHHPPFPVGIGSMDQISLRDPSALKAVLSRHRSRIRHIFFGHLHRPIAGSWLGIPVSTLRGTSHQVALVLGPTARIPGSHEPAQYGVVLADAQTVVVHLHDFDDQSARFEL